ncbi:proline-rich receptor-like protein kinase perk5 [Anaeramoeba ignava]|uniref:Proline-rich receptor-like protein kinase perk5 n=1 Tax=Anaeramoeba ignava TaxID=1746090 RepID=A0A9Q0LIC5_ANAIG|nr:proline-rich receptor-like protein kinase perk5 [Anaeramoeba ignava]
MDSLTMTCRICPKSYYCPGDNMPHLCYNADSSQIEYINIGENSSECSFRCTMQGYYNNLNQNCSRNPIGKFSEDGINLLDCQTLIDNRFSYFTSPGLTNETSCNSTFIFQSISNESAKNISLIPGDFTIEIFAQLDSQLLEKYLEYFPEDGFVFGLVGVYDLWELTLYIQNDSQPILENLNASLRLELSFKNNSLEEEEHKIFAPKLILSSEIFQFDDKWHHYAVIGNSKEFILSFYKDGNPIGKIWYNQSELADPSQLSEQDQEKLFLYFGGIRFRSESNFYYPKTSHWFYGELDELNIFNQSIEINQLGYFTTSKFIKYSCIGRENLLIQKDDSQILCVPKSAENTESITNYENLKAFDPNKWNSSLNSEIIHYTSQCPEYYDFFNDQCMLSCKGGSIRDNFNVQNCKCGYDEYKIWGFPNDQYLTLVFSLQNTSFPIEISEIQFVDSKGVYLEIEDCYEDDPFPQCRVLFDNIKKKSKLTMSSSSSYNFGFANVWIVSGVEPKRVTFKFLNQNANISNIAIYSSSSSNNSLIGFFDFYLSDILPPANSTNWGTKITTKINPIYSGITELIDRNTTSSYSNLTYCQKCSGNSSSSILPRTSVLDCICNQGFVRLNEPTHKCLIGKSGNSEPKLSLPSGLYARGTQVYGIMDDFSSDSYLQLEMSRFSSNGTILQKVEYFYSNSDFLSLEGSMNISATVKQDGYFDSQKVLYVYEVKPQVCQPETYPNASDPNLILPTKLVLFSRTINASIFYTVDGTDPTFSSKIYSPNDNLTAYQNLVVSAIATKSGEFPSEIVRIKFVDKILLSSSSSQDQQQSSNHFGFLGGSSQKESFLLITLLCAISILLFLIVVIPLIFWMKEKKKRKKELVDQIEFEQLLLENTKGGEIELNENENENENQNQNENQNEIKNLFSTDSKKTKESNIICDYCHQKDAVWRYPNPKNTRESLKFCGDCVDFFELYFDRLRLFCCDYCDENLAKTGKKELFFNQKTGLFSCDFCVGKQIADGFVDESDLFVVPVCDLCKKEEAVWFCSDCLDKKRFLCLDCECEAHICVFHSPEQITTWKNVKNEEIELSLENIQAK